MLVHMKCTVARQPQWEGCSMPRVIRMMETQLHPPAPANVTQEIRLACGMKSRACLFLHLCLLHSCLCSKMCLFTLLLTVPIIGLLTHHSFKLFHPNVAPSDSYRISRVCLKENLRGLHCCSLMRAARPLHTLRTQTESQCG